MSVGIGTMVEYKGNSSSSVVVPQDIFGSWFTNWRYSIAPNRRVEGSHIIRCQAIGYISIIGTTTPPTPPCSLRSSPHLELIPSLSLCFFHSTCASSMAGLCPVYPLRVSTV